MGEIKGGIFMSTAKAKRPPLEKLRLITVTGLFSALIFVFTAYLHIPTGAGYTHAGDGLIYLAACILPAPYAVASGVIGGALADGLSGYPMWIPATILIKALTALLFSRKTERILCLRNVLAIVPALVLCIVGYSVYEGVFLTKGLSKAALIAAFTQTPAYCVQVAASAALFIALAVALDRTDLRKRLLSNV